MYHKDSVLNFLGHNVYLIIYLASRYQMVGVVEMCVNYLLTQPPTVQNMIIAEECDLEKLYYYCRKNLPIIRSLEELETDKYYKKLSGKSKLVLIKSRLSLFEHKWKLTGVKCKCGVSCRNGHLPAELMGNLC